MPDRLAAAIERQDRDEIVRALLEGSAAILRAGDVRELMRAAEAIAPGGESLPVAVAWRIGFTLHLAGRLDEAVDWYARADPEQEDAAPDELARLHAAHASTCWARGEAAESRRLSDLAMDLAEDCGDDAALAAAWVARALVHALEGDRHSNRLAYASPW
jgi:tetratricopeptide (TPR) repeat protein